MTGKRSSVAAAARAVVEHAGVGLFAGMAAFGLLTGVTYGVLTREVAGTVLLVTFGVASSVAALGVHVGGLRQGPGAAPRASPTTDSDETSDLPRDEQDHGRSVEPGWAPFGVAVGLGAMAIGLAFGPWLLILGGIVAGIGARTWLAAAVLESGSRS